MGLPTAASMMAAFDGGTLYLKTDMPFYYAGQTVTGKIYIRADRDLDAKRIIIRVKGKEKYSHWYDHVIHYEEEYVDAEGNTQVRQATRTERRKKKEEKKIMDYKEPAYHFEGPLAPGDYIIPFEFVLPEYMSSSIMWKRLGHHDKPKMHVKYDIKAIMEVDWGPDLKYKQMLQVHEKPVAFEGMGHHQAKVMVNVCCGGACHWGCNCGCCTEGKTDIEALFDKNVFFSNEIANAMVKVDNSHQSIGVEEVEFQVV